MQWADGLESPMGSMPYTGTQIKLPGPEKEGREAMKGKECSITEVGEKKTRENWAPFLEVHGE